MLIKSFTFEPEYLKQFISFQYELYQDDDNWIPPLQKEIRYLLNPEYSFFKKGNIHRHFIAFNGKQIVGRITSMINRQLVDRDGTLIGLIGFFESIEDHPVASELITKALLWLKEQGIQQVWGPMNFDIWHSYRLMTKGFEEKSFYGELYNKQWYPEYFLESGFTVKAEWDSVEISGKEKLREMINRGEQRYQLLLKRGYYFETLNKSNFDNEINKLTYVMSKSFDGFLGFTPILPSELKKLFKKALHAIHPKMFLFAYNQDKELTGFAVALRDLGDAVSTMNGKSNIISKIKFLHHQRKSDRINFYLGGVTPEEIKSRSGLGRAGFYFIINQMLNEGYEKLLLTLRLKGNAAHALPGKFAPDPQREYALYERSI